MTTFEFLSYLRKLGVKVWADDGKLRYQAPEGAFSPSLRAELVQRKSEILQVLNELKASARPTPPPIQPIARNGELPLSFSQQRMWFLDQLEPGNAFYNEAPAVRMRGRLDISIMERALSEIVRRHESMRTVFPAIEGRPRQDIRPAYAVSFPIDDLSELPEDERQLELYRLIKAEAQHSFDLERGPLMTGRFLRVGANEHVMTLTIHHIITDGWSLGVLVREIGALYRAFAAGKPSPLPRLSIQYADYAHWQRQWMNGEVLESHLSYWRRQLAGGLEAPELPTDRPRPMTQRFKGARQRLPLRPELKPELEKLSREQGVTLFMTLLAAFKTLLHRYTGQTEIIVGSPVANRPRPEVEELIGFFVNTLVLRTDLSADPSFPELLSRIKKMALEAFAHQDLPFEKLVEALQPERDLSRTPLFQVMFQLETEVLPELELGGLELSLVEIDPEVAKFDLTLLLRDTAQGFQATIEYNTDLFDQWRIERMAGHFRTLIESVAADPERRIHEIELMNAKEREQVLIECNQTVLRSASNRCIHQLFEAQVARTPEAVAICFDDRQLSFHELNARANQMAHGLRKLGVGPEQVVGICTERSVEMLVSVLGILKAGAAYLPLDLAYPLERLLFILKDSGVSVLMTQTHLVSLFSQYEGLSVRLDEVGGWGAEESRVNPQTEMDWECPAYVIYTSGSTGKPKGVAMVHRALVNLIEWQLDHPLFLPPLRTLQFSSPSFDVSFQEYFATWCSGGSLVLIDEERHRDPVRLWEVLREEAIERLFLPFVALQQLAEAADPGETARISLRRIITAGESLRLSPPIEKMFGQLKDCVLENQYGPTESHVVASYSLPLGVEQWVKKLPPIGRPINNTQIYILDRWLAPAPVGVIGDLYLGGDALSRGYLNRPAQTMERFIPDPFSGRPGARLYLTGDSARYQPDGNIEFLGRSDGQVKVRGYRIELGEIEAVLGAVPGVRECAVAVRTDETGNGYLAGYLVCQEGEEPSVNELRRFLRQELPDYMVPSRFVYLASLPLTPSGKINRRALPAGERSIVSESLHTAPRTAIEEILAGVFGEVLNLDRVGVHDNFFELGGHSLLATQLASRVRNTFNVELRLGSVFEWPTVESLGRSLDKVVGADGKNDTPPLVRTSRDGKPPLSFAQQRLWFLDQLEPGSALYNCPGVVRLEGRLDVEAFERAINEIVRRHEVLRTRIEVEDNLPLQAIDEWEYRRWRVEDLSGLDPAARETEVVRLAKEEAETGFDMRRGPLVRVKVLRLEEEQHVVLFTMHHIVSDGWSIIILIREIGALYQAYLLGEESPLSELPIQYADFAVWQRAWLQGERLEQELKYWRKQLAGMEPLELPTDHPRPATPSHRGAIHHFVVGREMSEKLRALSQREGVTLFMTLLGGFDVLMSRYSGQRDVALGTDIANRNRAEIEGLIGFFVNQLVMRVEVRGGESFRKLLKRVREGCLGAYAHQDVPFEKLVEELQPERDLSRSPLFQAKLILQNMQKAELELEGLRLLSLGEDELETARFDLTVAINDEDGALAGVVVFSRDLFEAETIERLVSHYANVLKGIVDGSERPVSELSLLSEEDREQIVVEWNRTARPYPEDRCIHELFAEQAERTPERIAVVSEWQEVSYGELNRRANQVGRYLQRLGVGPEVVVGLCLARSAEMVVGALGVLKAGGAYLPLDAEHPLERLGYMLENAGVGVVLTQRALEARLPAFWGQRVLMDEEWERIGEESESEPESVVDVENLAYVIYTSGSTGRPKGVMLKHKGLCNLAEAQKEALELGDRSRVLQFASLSFDASVWEIFSTLAAGGSLCVYGRESLMPGDDLARVLRESEVTTVTLPPTVLAALPTEELPCLRTVIAAGEACTAEIVKRWARGRRFIDAYGPTEVTVCASLGACEAGSDREPTIGRPIANTQLYILDHDLNPAPVGVRGELYISSVGETRGYSGRPELTAEKLVPNLFSHQGGERLYRTGDVVRYSINGEIEFIGRGDEQVKIRGFRIELGEIEAVLNEHHSVRQSVVVAREDERGEKRLIGYVVGGDGATAAELKRYLLERVPEYMAPEAILILEEMPVTVNGKIDRKRLPVVEGAGMQPEREDVGARTPVEEILAGIFGDVLKLDWVGLHDNFFELGGHSLLATQVISRVRNTFGVEIGVRRLFEGATVKELGRQIDATIKLGEREEAPPLVSIPREGLLPLSFAQQRLWFIDQLEPGQAVYNCPVAVRMEGWLEVDVLERALNEIIRRHEALRTRIEVEANVPVQVIDPWEPRRLERTDLTNLPSEERDAEVRRIAKAEAWGGFDLRRGPLIRMHVLKLEEEQHVALCTMHHIVSDGWSMGVLVKEVCALYDAMSEGAASPLPELEIQYADYARWQREYLAGGVLEGEIAYWKEKLKDAAVMELPTDYPRPSTPSHRGGSERVTLGREVSEGLKRLSQREGATLFMVLMAAFKALLMRYSGAEDLSVGTVIANRTRKEIEGLIGFFVNTLVMRTDLSGNPSFRELIGREREVALGAYGRQEAPFEKLVEEINPERDLSRSPLFQVMMELQNAELGKLEIRGLKMSGVGEETGVAKFDLELMLTEEGEGIRGILGYSQDLYEGETIGRMARHYERVVTEVVRDAEQKICEIELMSEEEKRQLLGGWERARVEYDRDRRIHQLFEEQVERSPEAVAIVYEEEQISYWELNRRANRLGRCLQKQGVGPEVLVGVCLERSIEMVAAALGVWKAGGVYVPMDPSYPEQRLRLMMEEVSVCVFGDEGREGGAPEGCQARALSPGEAWSEAEECWEEACESVVSGENAAYVIYTSGSSGEPKGVIVAHRNLTNLLKVSEETFGFEAGEEMLCLASFSFDISLFELLNPLVVGGKVNLLNREQILDMDRLLGEMKKASVVHAVPTLMREVIEGIEREGEPSSGYGKIEKVFVGGELAPLELLSEMERVFKGARIEVLYGPTEGTVICSSDRVVGGEPRGKNLIGRPLSNQVIRIYDERSELAPIGVRGELRIGGAGVARGYLKRAELTAERFTPEANSEEPGARVYRTGDLGRYGGDGKIEFLGRGDGQVKIRGYRIELGEIEAVLNEHRSVRQSVVTASEDGRGGKRLLGYVVGEEGVTTAELKRHVRERLPEYMAPEAIMVLEEMPVTVNGKIDRKRLPSMNGAGRQLEREYLGARTAIEEILVGIFEEVLELDRVGIRDNFFESGGHSLLATQAISRVREVFGVEIGVRSIFEEPAVAGLAHRIEEAIKIGEKEEALPIVTVSRDQNLPLSFAQQRLWFLDQLAPNSPFYNSPGSVKLEGRLNFEALEWAINQIIRRHEALRTRFEVVEGMAAQVIDPWEPRRLERVDLTKLTAQELEVEVRRITNEEAGTGFDLRQGPLIRVKVLKLEDEQHVALITMHHIVSDGWSTGILIREAGALYRAYLMGEESPLSELPIQYADFAVWQRAWLQGERLEQELEYWRKQLAGMTSLELPTDHPRPAAPSRRGVRYHYVIEEAVAERLRALSQREGVTLFMTLLGGFDVVMSRYSGQEDIVLGTDIANRNRAEIEGVIGFFVNQLVMRVGLRGGESFGELLKRVRDVCLGAYAHQDVPFEKLVEELQPERDLSRSPLFQAKLNLQNTQRAELELEGLRLLSLGEGEIETAKIDLTMTLREEGRELIGVAEYSRDLFEAATIERLVSHYANVLKGILGGSERPVSEFDLLSDQEREQILMEWNQTVRSYPRERCIHELFAEQAERTPERIALIDEREVVSYGDLNRRANRLGHYLQRLGVGPEVVVGLCLERSVEMVVGVLGVLKAGGAYLPLDAEYPLERLGYMLENAGVGVVLTQRALEARLPTLWGQTVLLDEEWERIGAESEREPESGVETENLVYLIYTSGSTGRPKGVMVRHRSLVNYTHDICRQLVLLSEEGRNGLQFATVSTITADLGNTCIYPSLMSGGCLHVLSYEVATDGMRFEEYLRRDPIDVLKIVPSHLSALLRSQPTGVKMLPRKYLILGGEALPLELVERIHERGEGCEVINHYGPTETTIGSLTLKVSEMEETSRRSVTVPIGRPIANTVSYILDRHLMPVPVGVRGELYISGGGVARGYCGGPEPTAERFIPDLFSLEGGERLYRTGDVVRYLSNGRIEFIGRADEQVKVRGYRIELGEIEAVLNEHRSVRQSVVTASEDGRGGKRLLGYVVGEEGVTAAELKRHVRERLPEYMAPEAIMVLEEMPVTMNGKIDRKRLPSMNGAGRQLEREYLGARTAIEEILVGIFEEVLKQDRIGRLDNFFERGGHSLLATQVISRVRDSFGVELGVRSIFEDATIERFGRRVEAAIRGGEKGDMPSLTRASREGRLPLSFAQQRLWFIDQLEPGNDAYNCPAAVRLEGRLDLEVLESAINEIVRRHEVLRTRIEVAAGTPAQVIDQWEPRKLEREDLSRLETEEREEEVRRITKEEAETGFDLSRGPLLRVKALKLGAEQHVLLFTMHHIVSDAWSMGVLVKEVCALYEAISEGQESPLPELEIQYADYAKWQREYLAGGVLENKVGYWKEQLKDAAILELPTDYPRPATPSYRGGLERIELGREVSEGLKRLSQREGATLFMALMVAFKALLMRYSGQEDLSVGTTIANRTRKEVEGLIGFFVNTLVMRTDLSGNPSFRELIRREREVALGAYGRQEAPFEKLVEEINPERDLSRSPLFQVMMELQNAERGKLEIRGLKVSGIGEETGTAKFDLTLTLMEGSEGIDGGLEYSLDLYGAETIRRMARHYERVVAEVVKDADQRVNAIELMSGSEREQILAEWNETAQAYPQDQLAHELFEEQVERTPEAVAVVFQDQALSYRELNARANQLARVLVEHGVGPEILVAVLAERGVDFLITMLAIFKAGGAYIPLDPHHPARRIGQALSGSGANFVITASQFESLAAEAVAGLTAENHPAMLLLESLFRDFSQEENLGLSFVSNQLAYVIFTSGSTGAPKGAMVEQGGMLNHLFAKIRTLQLDDEDVVAETASQCFDISVWQFLAALLVGGQVQIIGDDIAHDPAALLDQIELSGITILEIVPTMMRTILTEADRRQVKPDLSTVRCMIPTGEALPPDLCYDWFLLYPEIPLLNAYGPTECSDDVTHYSIDGGLSEGTVRVPIGRPIANTQIYVVNAELQPQPVGIVGELYIGGVGVGRGYLNEACKTSESFAPSPFTREAGARLYKSGDLAVYSPDGNLEYVGRIDHQVKVRGFRIELGEIEAVLREHPQVRQSVVVGSEDKRGGKRLVGYVVGAEGVTAAELKRHVRERLPEYMAPEAILILEEMPVTVNGKIDRKRLPEVEEVGREIEQEYVGARSPVEEILAGIFGEVLKLDRVGIHDNFFELGGHSLLATQAISRVREVFGVEIGVRSIFEESAVAGLAQRIEEAIKIGEKEEALPIVAVSRDQNLPLSFAQQRLWFIDQLEPNSTLYNISGAVKLEGRLNLEALEWAINQIIRRHEALRTKFEVVEGMAAQVIDPWEPRRLERADLTFLTAKELEVEVQRIMNEEAGTGFDLRRGPLIRVKVLRLEEDQHVALFTMHHIVSDGWSMEILIREVGALYQAYLTGEESPLSELPIQYADYAMWQRQYFTDKVLEKHLAYWKKQFSGPLPALDLPAAHPRPLVPSYRGATKSFSLSAELSTALKSLSRQEGATPFMTLLAAFKTLLYGYTAQEDIIIGTPVANRNRAEIEPLIGFFINMLPLRTDLSGNPRFRELLKRVKDVALDGFAHQDLPLEELIKEIRPERSIIEMPLFNVVFGVQNIRSEDLKLRDLEVKPMVQESNVARFDLSLLVNEGLKRTRVLWVYRKDLFEEEAVIRMHGHFEALLFNIVDRPEARLTALNVLSRGETVLSNKEQGDREESDLRKLRSVKRKTIIVSSEPD